MQSAAERILNENFNTDEHTLSFSAPMLELSIPTDSIYEDEFEIYGPDRVFVEGKVSTTGLRMKSQVAEFAGSKTTIPFTFDSSGLSDGDNVKGEFRIISNQGEYLLPYDVRINSRILDTSLGNIKNLFHFTNLARSNWSEAVEVFYSEDFEQILAGAEKQYLHAYQALKSGDNKEQNLEEFLLFIKKKQPAEFIVEEPEIRIESASSGLNRNVVIQRNGWGYSTLFISTDTDFIKLKKDIVSDNDFSGNMVRIPYEIDKEALHEGRNYGYIFLKNAYNSIKISVCALVNPLNRKVLDISRSAKYSIIEIIKYYEAFRCRKISSTTWFEATQKIVDSLIEKFPDDKLYELYRVQLLITSERFNEARWILEQLENYIVSTDNVVNYCYYYYLTSLVDRSYDHTEEVTSLVERFYSENEDEWRLFWLLLYLSEDYAKNPALRWEKLREQFYRGASSPIIFVEAYQVLINNPTILIELGEFEKQLLRYMAKKEILTVDIIEQFIYLLGKGRVYDKRLYKLLVSCYAVYPDDEVLKCIVTLLININSLSKESHKWYEKAVEKNLRITKLYEYYMMSLDFEEVTEIPKIVLMYFAFDSTLSVYHNSFLYCYVYKNRELLAGIYENYKTAIERFVSFQLINGVNNKYLAYLYRNMITPTMITEDVAKGLSKALFIHSITPNRNDIRSVVISYENLITEFSYQLAGEEELLVPLYGNNYRIVLVDEDGNRYVREDEYTCTRLMGPEKYGKSIEPLVEDLLFDLWVCEHGKEIYSITEDNLQAMKRLSENRNVQDALRREIRIRLLKFYFEEDKMSDLDDLLSRILITEVPVRDMQEVIRLLIQRDMCEKAYDWLTTGGGDNVEPKLLLKLCERLLEGDGSSLHNQYDPVMISIIFRAFQMGKYKMKEINYLSCFFDGTSKEMRDILRASKEFGIDNTSLTHRLLEQILYTNAFVPGTATIFGEYALRRLDDELSLAFLAQQCFDYFVNEKLMDDEYIRVLQSFIDMDLSVPFVCKLAYTKYYSDKKEMVDENISRTLVVYLKEILVKGMYFPYFKEYASSITYMHRFMDKTMIEYRVKDGTKASIHYMIEKNTDSNDEYVCEEMKDMYHGICVKQFVLFFGERLQYYIVEKNQNGEMLTVSDTVTQNDVDDRESMSRYSMINDISIARTLGDYGTMDKLLFEYFQNEYLLDNMFKISE